MKTRGMVFLERHDIDFTLHEYEHTIKGAVFAAEATGIRIEQMIKTLVVADRTRNLFSFVLMPGHLELDLKLAAQVLNTKKLGMASVKEAEKLTGYLVGGISPFGSRTALSTLLDDSLTHHSTVAINGGARGCIVTLSLPDLLRILNPTVASFARS